MKNVKNADKPAAPIVNNMGFPSDSTAINIHSFTGLTKREYFAAMAMQALLSAINEDSEMPAIAGIPYAAVGFADSLLKALEET